MINFNVFLGFSISKLAIGVAIDDTVQNIYRKNRMKQYKTLEKEFVTVNLVYYSDIWITIPTSTS